MKIRTFNGRSPVEPLIAPLTLARARVNLALFFTYFEIKKSSAGTALGLVWIILRPFIQITAYVVVFAFIMNARLPGSTDSFAYVEYVLLGMIPWMLISASLTDGVEVVKGYANFIRQPNFPYKILPFVVILKNLPPHLVGLLILLVIMAISGRISAVNPLLLAGTYALLLITITGAASVLGALAARLPDVKIAVPLVLMIAVYLAPIFYTPEQMGGLVVAGILNPFSYMVTTFKYAMTGDVRFTLLGPMGDYLVLAVLAMTASITHGYVLKLIRQTGIDYVA